MNSHAKGMTAGHAGDDRPRDVSMASELHRDPVSGLPGLEAFSDALQARLASRPKSDREVAVLLLELMPRPELPDGVSRSLDDSDARLVSSVLRRLVPDDSRLGRIHAEWFAIMLSGNSIRAAAEDLANKVLESVAAALEAQQAHAGRITCAVVVAESEERDGNRVLRRALRALARTNVL